MCNVTLDRGDRLRLVELVMEELLEEALAGAPERRRALTAQLRGRARRASDDGRLGMAMDALLRRAGRRRTAGQARPATADSLSFGLDAYLPAMFPDEPAG
jgi:hypothetical protein